MFNAAHPLHADDVRVGEAKPCARVKQTNDGGNVICAFTN